jgi:osmotically-inducible protein OsmY
MLFAAFACGCGGDDTERLGRIGRKTLARCDNVTASLRGRMTAGIDAVRSSIPQASTSNPAPTAPAPQTFTPPAAVSTTPIDARVLWRLRWDKTLAGADIQVETPSGGVVQIRGVVDDLPRQRRAVELAETTEGVDKVVSELGLKQP